MLARELDAARDDHPAPRDEKERLVRPRAYDAAVAEGRVQRARAIDRSEVEVLEQEELAVRPLSEVAALEVGRRNRGGVVADPAAAPRRVERAVAPNRHDDRRPGRGPPAGDVAAGEQEAAAVAREQEIARVCPERPRDRNEAQAVDAEPGVEAPVGVELRQGKRVMGADRISRTNRGGAAEDDLPRREPEPGAHT